MQQFKKCLLVFYLLLFASAAHADDHIKDSLAVFHSLDSLYGIVVHDNPPQALNICMRLEAIAHQFHIDSLILEATLNKGESLNFLGFFDMAMKEYYDALSFAERLKAPWYEAAALYSIGMIYTDRQDYKRSKTFLEKAKAQFIAAGSFTDTIRINFNLGYMCCVAGELDRGLTIIKTNIRIAQKVNDEPDIVTGLNTLAHIYFDRHENEQALSFMLEVLKHPEGFNNNYYKVSQYEHLAEVYVAMKQWDNARKYLAESFKYAKLINSNDWLYDCYKLQSKIDAGTGNYKSALEAHQSYMRYKDTVFNANYENKIAALSSLYELEKKQGKISLLERDNQISAAKIKQEAWQRNSVIAGSVLIIGLLIALFLVKIQTRTKNLQIAFSRSLMQSQEMERQRISRELHDSVGQNILFIKNQLSAQGGNPSLTPVMEAIGVTIDEVRNISKDLYPNQLEKYGLPAAVNALAEKVSSTTGIFVSADLHEIEGVLWKEANINLYRIVQEALNNAIKHAEAKAIRITGTKANDRIILAVMDNGKGFDSGTQERKAQGASGLLNMEERAKLLDGRMELESAATGTKITITIPMQNEV